MSVIRPKQFPIICISGTPGTGKSTWSKVIEKKLGFYRLDLHHHYKQVATKYDRSKQCFDIDLKLFTKLVKDKIKLAKKEGHTGIVIDTHISHLLLPKLVDMCVILTCSNLKKLEKRLLERKYSKKKIRENLDTEIFQVCLTEAQELGHNIVTFDTSKRVLQKDFLEKIQLTLS